MSRPWEVANSKHHQTCDLLNMSWAMRFCSHQASSAQMVLSFCHDLSVCCFFKMLPTSSSVGPPGRMLLPVSSVVKAKSYMEQRHAATEGFGTEKRLRINNTLREPVMAKNVGYK